MPMQQLCFTKLYICKVSDRKVYCQTSKTTQCTYIIMYFASNYTYYRAYANRLMHDRLCSIDCVVI